MSIILRPSMPVMTSQVLAAPTQVSQVLTTPVVSQPSLAVVPQTLVEPVVQPVAQPLVQSIVQPVVQPIVTPAVQTVATPIVTPVVAPTVATSLVAPVVPTVAPPMTQLAPQPVLQTPGPQTLAPSPDYSRFIPPTPMTSTLANEMPPRIYQFYKLAPTPAPTTTPVALTNVALQQVPAFSTVSTPVVNTGLALGGPQFNTYTLV